MITFENFVVAIIVLGAVVMLCLKFVRTYKDGGCRNCCKGADCACCMHKREEYDSNNHTQN